MLCQCSVRGISHRFVCLEGGDIAPRKCPCMQCAHVTSRHAHLTCRSATCSEGLTICTRRAGVHAHTSVSPIVRLKPPPPADRLLCCSHIISDSPYVPGRWDTYLTFPSPPPDPFEARPPSDTRVFPSCSRWLSRVGGGGVRSTRRKHLRPDSRPRRSRGESRVQTYRRARWVTWDCVQPSRRLTARGFGRCSVPTDAGSAHSTGEPGGSEQAAEGTRGGEGGRGG